MAKKKSQVHQCNKCGVLYIYSGGKLELVELVTLSELPNLMHDYDNKKSGICPDCTKKARTK